MISDAPLLRRCVNLHTRVHWYVPTFFVELHLKAEQQTPQPLRPLAPDVGTEPDKYTGVHLLHTQTT